MGWLFSIEGLVTILAIVVILILLVVLTALIFIVKTIKDVRDTVKVVHTTTGQINKQGFVPFMKDSQLRSDLMGEFKKKVPRLLPVILSGFMYSVVKKATTSTSKKKATSKRKK